MNLCPYSVWIWAVKMCKIQRENSLKRPILGILHKLTDRVQWTPNYLLGKEIMFLLASVYLFMSFCLFVCLLATLLKNYMNGMKFYGGVWGGKGNKWLVLVAIQIAMLTAQSEIRPLLNKWWTDLDGIFRIALQWYKEQLINCLGWSGSSCWLSKSGSETIC